MNTEHFELSSPNKIKLLPKLSYVKCSNRWQKADLLDDAAVAAAASCGAAGADTASAGALSKADLNSASLWIH